MKVGARVEDWAMLIVFPGLVLVSTDGQHTGMPPAGSFFCLAFHYLTHTAITMDQPKGYSTKATL